jgi:hypothetical protein
MFLSKLGYSELVQRIFEKMTFFLWTPYDTICKGLRGCMALTTLRCYGDASSPEQRSALRAIHPLNNPNIISACPGDRRPSI